ncbi:DsbC family protein [Achromobacter xylosoxidans]|uniref:DsbC family protein n=1 Tax=Alcaligenes xylosoxydans xylosoxydans TaxID=85698 RepID=UPI001EEC824B
MGKRFGLRASITLVASLLGGAAAASPAADQVRATLEAKYPGSPLGTVMESPVPGIFEVVWGKNLVYVEQTGRYFLFGNLYDMVGRADLTSPRRAELMKVAMDTLPMQDAFARVIGNGERKVALFTDPDCPYCQRLEQAFAQVGNVTIYTFLFPLDSLHPNANLVARKIWCAGESQRGAAYDAYMASGAQPDNAGQCDNPVARNVELGRKLNIQGTPYLIGMDGSTKPGALAPADLDAWLNASNRVKAAQ